MTGIVLACCGFLVALMLLGQWRLDLEDDIRGIPKEMRKPQYLP